MIPRSLLRRWIAGLITVATISLTSGCVFDIGTIRTDVTEEVLSVRAQLKQEITRAEVREILGSPYFQNELLRVEAYRKTGTDVAVGWLMIMPMAIPADKHIYHFFIAYDETWKVFDSQVGSDRLVAADLMLVATSVRDRPEVLLATREMSRQALSTPPRAGTCALILLSNPSAMERVLVDGVELVDLDSATWYGTLSNTFSRHEIDAGEHALEVAQQSVTGSFRQKFSCNSGTFTFVRLEARNIRKYWSWHGVIQEGEIVITMEPPPKAIVLRQILAHGDDWYGFAESYYGGAADRRANAASPERLRSLAAAGDINAAVELAAKHGETQPFDSAEIETKIPDVPPEIALELFEQLEATHRVGNERIAWRLLCRAADSGMLEAQLLVAYLHREDLRASAAVAERRWVGGAGIAPDDRVAFLWYSLAAASGSKSARLARNHLAGKLDSSRLSDAEGMVWRWQPGECEELMH